MRYPPKDKGSRVKCVDCVANLGPDMQQYAYLGSRCSDGKYRCEPHKVRYLYSSGEREAHGGFL